ncbi:hypothetical protein RB653_007540 [Dictyostelium firmibasis]|uniref:Uncharacterized protein n=1 Tax=Dictyostelium firmibasis TaxID=79012 RepID=A0AAN7YUR3_9MYCE
MKLIIILLITIINLKLIYCQNSDNFPFFNCIGNLEYLGVDKVQPFGFNTDPYVLQWGESVNNTFPEVLVEISGENNPLLVGNLHPYEKLERENAQFFDVAGKQDIKSLMHYTCGKKESSVTFSFKEQFEKKKEFILLVFGMTPNAVLNIKAYDWSGQLLPGTTWQELERGLLHHGQKDIVRLQSNLNVGRASANLKWTGGSLTTYDIFYPSISSSKISKVELLLSHSCSAPECKGITLFYSLIANDLCYKQSPSIDVTTPPPTNRPSTQSPIQISASSSQSNTQSSSSSSSSPSSDDDILTFPPTETPTQPPTETPTEPLTEPPTDTPIDTTSGQSNDVPNPLRDGEDDITITIVPMRHRATRPPYRARRSQPPTQTIPSAWD